MCVTFFAFFVTGNQNNIRENGPRESEYASYYILYTYSFLRVNVLFKTHEYARVYTRTL